MRLTFLNRRSGSVVAPSVAAVSALVVAVVLTGCGSGPGPAASAPGPLAHVITTAPSGPAAHNSPSAPTPLGSGQIGTLNQVPWGEVGPGWALADYTTGSAQTAGPVTLYVLDPEGGMYRIYQWPATTQPWYLVAWSGDKQRVLFQQPGLGQPTLHQLTIATGQITTFYLPADVTSVLGYTRPDGENLLADENGIVRYSLTGAFQARLSQGGQFDSAVNALDGSTEVVSASSGVQLVSNAGGTIRWLPVPGTNPRLGCAPVRWWSAADMLVRCTPDNGIFEPQLWLVPVSGAAPSALTPVRSAGGPDLGDFDAWQLPTGLYLNSYGGCGTVFIGKQTASGAVQVVNVPGSPGNNLVIAASGSRMLVQERTECSPSTTLVWFEPATAGVQSVLTAQAGSTGVVSAIAFNGDGEQPSA